MSGSKRTHTHTHKHTHTHTHCYICFFPQTPTSWPCSWECVGLASTIYIRCMQYFGREITKYTVIYGAYTRFWPTLNMCPSFPHPVLAARLPPAFFTETHAYDCLCGCDIEVCVTDETWPIIRLYNTPGRPLGWLYRSSGPEGRALATPAIVKTIEHTFVSQAVHKKELWQPLPLSKHLNCEHTFVSQAVQKKELRQPLPLSKHLN